MTRAFHNGIDKAVDHGVISVRNVNWLLDFFYDPSKIRKLKNVRKTKIVHMLNDLVPYYVTEEQAKAVLDEIPDWEERLNMDY